MPDDLAAQMRAIETAMVAIRRSQSRRRLSTRARGASRSPFAGLPDSVFAALDAVEAAEDAGQEAGVATVRAALGVDQPRASKIIAAAVEAGLLRRTADQQDGRRALLVRTATGRRVSQEIHEYRRGQFAAAMADWTPSERRQFARLLPQFVAGLDAALRDPSGSNPPD